MDSKLHSDSTLHCSDSALRYKASKIKLLALDVDGVLTDGRLYFLEDGSEIKAFDTQDGHGIKMLQSAGVEVAIITGRTTNLVARRAQNLGIKHLYQGREDKVEALKDLLGLLRLTADQVAYMGDDLPDLSAITFAGLGLAPANAHAFVKTNANLVTQTEGGRGAVREVCDFILSAQGALEGIHARYLGVQE